MAHTDPHGAHGASRSVEVGHELSDADVSGVGKMLLFTGIFVAACFVFVWFVLGAMQRQSVASDTGTSPAVPRQGDRRPPVPRLQVAPRDELEAFRRVQQETLNSWAWTDPEQRVARVPVERAIEILAERGLPTPPPVPVAPAVAAVPGGTAAAPAAPAR